MLSLSNIPSNVSSYIANLYSQLHTYFVTKDWSSATLPVRKDIFQGDTLSSVLFLLAFNPIVRVANSLSTLGCSLKLPIPNSAGLPPLGSHLYVEWSEETSSEPQGWCSCSVVDYFPSGLAKMMYRDESTEEIDLHNVKWFLTRKNSKYYLPLSTTPQFYPQKKVCALPPR